MSSIKMVNFAYVGSNQSNALFELKVQFGKSILSGEETTAYKPLRLAIGSDDRLQIFDAYNNCILAKTSPIMDDVWMENVSVGNRTFPLAKCYTTKSGSQHFFVPVSNLLV